MTFKKLVSVATCVRLYAKDVAKLESISNIVTFKTHGHTSLRVKLSFFEDPVDLTSHVLVDAQYQLKSTHRAHQCCK